MLTGGSEILPDRASLTWGSPHRERDRARLEGRLPVFSNRPVSQAEKDLAPHRQGAETDRQSQETCPLLTASGLPLRWCPALCPSAHLVGTGGSFSRPVADSPSLTVFGPRNYCGTMSCGGGREGQMITVGPADFWGL